jgi:NADP-dependent 3-hydroxy acid dehydrogenase YdfG
MISEGLRQQVNTFGIRTTVISPGAVDTQLTGSITEADIGAAARDR